MDPANRMLSLKAIWIWAVLLCTGWAAAQVPAYRPPVILNTPSGNWINRLESPYRPKGVSEIDPTNTKRLYDLLRAGNIYLSLSDAIALAIENNLEVQISRYGIPIADTDVLRSKGGGTLRGVSLNTVELPSGVGGPASPVLTVAATGSTPSTSVPNNVFDLSLINITSNPLSLTSGSFTSPLPSAAGPPIPQFDPLLIGSLSWSHQTTPEANSLVSGASSLVTNGFTGSLGLQQGFSSGTQYTLGYNSSSQSSNSTRNTYNPYTTGSLGLTVTQPLLRGFGIAVNRRYITIAKNDRRISDMIFRQQLINVIYGISRLYYDLAGLFEDVRVKQETLATARTLYDNTKARVDEGTLAQVELTRAEAQVAGAQEDLINSEGLLEDQEAIIKTVLTRKVAHEPVIQSARVIPTEPFSVPQKEEIPSLGSILPEALKRRPDLQQGELEIANSEIALRATRNALLPEVDLIGTAQNNGLTGQPNPRQTTTGITPGMVDPNLVGGYSNLLTQIAARRYPTYEIGIQVSLPLRNRVAQADVVRDELSFRTYQTQLLQRQNQAELEIQDALIALHRSRAGYEAAVRARTLQAESLDVEQARFEAGVSTALLVIQYQSYLAQARSTEVVAKGNYFKARAALDRVLGASLEANHISFEDAYRGQIR